MRRLVLGAVAALLLTVLSCTRTSGRRHDVIVVCDGSGDSMAVCSRAALLELGEDWALRAAVRPGSVFSVITSAANLANTKVVVSMVSPPIGSRDPRHARDALLAQVARSLEAVDIPRDDPRARHTNVSDGVAALAVASRILREEGLDGATVVVMSDGRWVSPGIVNAEKTVPSGDDVFSRAKEAGFDIDLGRVRTVLACGLGTSGMTAAQVAARDDMVVGFFKAAGAPAPVVRSSCAKGLVLP